MRNTEKGLFCFILFVLIAATGYTQGDKGTTLNTITIGAGPEYKTSSFHQWLWGKNYRKEWATPIRVPVALLDTLGGGLKPTKAGGGNQTQSLHVETKAEKRYTLRTVNKTLGKVLPKDFLNTFVEDILNDKVSMSHPYGAAPIPALASAAKIYHTNPTYVYLPKQKTLDSFKSFENKLYLFEQKVDGNWKEANNLGNYDDFTGTFKLLDKLQESNTNQVDQKAYVKARLFDMLINDWDRHEDQWEWGKKDSSGQQIYQAIPQDRDQAFFNYNGVLLKLAMGASGLKYFQQFRDKIPDVNHFNYEQRNLDRLFANKLTLSDWQTVAKELRLSLTDNVIDEAMKRLPPEINAISGNEIASKLKKRRDDLEQTATTYYRFIAKAVDITGSKEREQFEVSSLNEDNLAVNIYAFNKNGKRNQLPFYSRTFNKNETQEVRLYGISGNDIYTVGGTANNNIKLRLIGGNERDSMTVSGGRKVHIYDNRNNAFPANNAKLHLSNDSAIHEFKYAQYHYSKRGISPIIFFNNEDRLFVGLGYTILTNKWRKEPFASKQSFFVNYSLSQKAFRVVYNGLFPKVIGNWDLDLLADYDAVRWTNFFGLGNETPFTGKEIDYYRARTEEWIGRAGLVRRFGHNTVRLNGFVQRIRLINDEEKFIAKQVVSPGINDANNFAGGQLAYSFVHVNDSIVPTRGIAFFGSTAYIQNIKKTSRSIGNYAGHLQLYIPLISKFSLAIRTGASRVSGEPEFYQYTSIGGSQTVRAFRRDRFWGTTAFYNSNEFRYISNVKSYIFNGKLGLVAFYDNGRVWMPGEKSDVWHTGYGGGVLISPFNKILADITYGISKDEKLLQLRLSTSF